MFRSIFSRFRPQEVKDADGLQLFVAQQSAFITQKCVIEYCRARAGLNWDKLFLESAFVDALERCRWDALAAVQADVVVMVEGYLRPHIGLRIVDLSRGLLRLYAANLEDHPAPAHLEDGWRGWVDALEERLTGVRALPAAPAAEIALVSGAIVFDSLPIHRSLRGHDREMVTNNIRFAMVGCRDRMERRVRAAEVARDLLDGVSAGATD